jgi:protein-disulfide isomerase
MVAPSTQQPADAVEHETTTRTRLYQLAALLLSVCAIGAVAIAVLTSGSTSQLTPGKPVPGAPQTLALFAGIPQHGIALGDPRAPVTLEEFGDLQCPVCAAYAEDALPTIVERYVRNGRVRLVFRNLDSIGSDSVRAARMAGAVGEQNHLWEFIDLMYKNQGAENTSYVTDRYLQALATAIPGVAVSRALRERSSTTVEAQIEQAHALAQELHLQSTPSFVLAPTPYARTVQAGAGQAGGGRAGTGQAGTGRAGTGQVGAGRAGTGQVGAGPAGQVLPSTDLSAASLEGPIDRALASAEGLGR